ncbi:substrate-binding domain-containing protein [Acuticoccus kandeliae]|uniref:substrate-binding domain-containing protein n=1 Tax=Acuticoccus kandeliae TaxID=2073160 RepID=UPI000D3E950B|nr:substrate-binding domain-containing protein [Acuticoccus kandeliae]
MTRGWIAGLTAALLLGGIAPALAQDELAASREIVEAYSKPNPPWDGPTTGPAAQSGKLIVYVSTDQRNGGARGVGEGVVEAAELIGWDTRTIDGQGTVSGRSSGLTQAIALQPDVIVLGGIDANEQAALVEEADKAGIKVIGWHAYATTGPHPSLPIFTNITTDPMKVAAAAAAYAVVTSEGKAGAIVFTDSVYEIAVAKANAMADVIRACANCKLLEYIDTPLSDTAMRMPPMTTALLQKYGDEWTHALSINDLTFDFMAPALASAGIAGDGHPTNISAGDGSEAAFQRIRDKQFQAATVAEPLRLQGWQVVDEANRALAGEKDSGYVAPPHLFTPDNIGFDGGPNNIYDPDNGYTEIYAKIWNAD